MDCKRSRELREDKTERRRLCAAVWATGVGAAALLVFVWTLAPTVTAEDSGELIAAAWHFGIPHPPGYPLWTMLCGGFVHLLHIGSVAWRANLFSALCGAAAAAVAYGAIRELPVSRPVAASAVLVWVWGRWSWSQSVITEVYALNSLMTAGVLWCGLRWFRTRRSGPLVVASLLMGLGMCNHHVIALAGLAVVAWIVIQQPRLMLRARLVAGCVGLFALGLLCYIYLPLRAQADPPINWGNPDTLERAWKHISRQQYGAIGPMDTVEPRSIARFGSQLGYLANSVRDDMTTVIFASALLGCVVMWRGQRRLLLLVVLWLACTGGLFALLANYDLDRTSRSVMRVFLIPVSLGLTIPLAFLLEALCVRIRSALGSRTRAIVLVLILLVLAGPTMQLAAHWEQCDYSNYWWAYDHAENLLACMLPGALLFPSGDHNTFPVVYLTAAENKGDDVVMADMYGYLNPALHESRPPDAPDDPTAWVVKRARRPVYYTTKRSPPVANASFVTAGILYHLLPNRKPFDGSELLGRCDYRNLNDPAPIDFGASHILCDYEFFRGLGELEAGYTERARDHFAAAADYGHDIKEVYNNIGSALAEHGHIEWAVPYFEKAAALDERYVLPRWNLFRTAIQKEDWARARDRLDEILRAEPDDPRAYAEMGFLLSRLGDRAGAARYWRASLERESNQPRIKEQLSAHQNQSIPNRAQLN